MPGQVRDDREGLQRLETSDADLVIEQPFAFSRWETFGPGVIANSTDRSYVRIQFFL
jgi:hypothetical protein